MITKCQKYVKVEALKVKTELSVNTRKKCHECSEQKKKEFPEYSTCTLLSTCLRKWVVAECRNSLSFF